MNLARKSNRDSLWLKATYNHELFVDGQPSDRLTAVTLETIHRTSETRAEGRQKNAKVCIIVLPKSILYMHHGTTEHLWAAIYKNDTKDNKIDPCVRWLDGF